MPTPGVFIKVNSKGHYYSVEPDGTGGPPTRILLSSYGLSSGDYIGLQKAGAYKAGVDFNDNSTGMGGVFVDSSNRFIRPSSVYDHMITPPTYPNSHPTDIAEDFNIHSHQTILKIPNDANQVLFCPPDSYFSDNSDPNNDYGVYLTAPNSPPGSGLHVVPDSLDIKFDACCNDLSEEADAGVLFSDQENMNNKDISDPSHLQPLFYEQNSKLQTNTSLQYRGWYLTRSGGHVWYPRLSHYMGRPSVNHYGVDLFTPIGTVLVSPVDGILVRRSDPNGFGNYVLIGFTFNNRQYTYLIAHLDQIVANDGQINRGDPIGTVGCSGNAASPNPCGSPNLCGGRSDHYHVEVSQGAWSPNATRVDVVSEWNWRIKYQNDSSVILCSP